jgi:hypothetical protein
VANGISAIEFRWKEAGKLAEIPRHAINAVPDKGFLSDITTNNCHPTTSDDILPPRTSRLYPLKMSLSLNLTIDDFDPIIGEVRDSSADERFADRRGPYRLTAYSSPVQWTTPNPQDHPSWFNQTQEETGSVWHEGMFF